MSDSNNPITNYFKNRIVDNVEESDKMSSESSSTDDNEPSHAKRARLDEFADSTSLPITTSTLNSTINSSTTESTMSLSLAERDPCLGPVEAKKHLLAGPFQPTTKFPTVNNRHFCAKWYNSYPWLEYSVKLDRAFCFPCRLRNDSRFETAFTTNGFNRWKNGISRFNRHQASDSHKECFERWKTTVGNYDHNTDVLKSLDQQYSKQAAENRTYLRELIRTIHFLARQGISCKLFYCLYIFIYRNVDAVFPM